MNYHVIDYLKWFKTTPLQRDGFDFLIPFLNQHHNLKTKTMSTLSKRFLIVAILLSAISMKSQEANSNNTELYLEIERYLYNPDQTKKKSKKYFSETKAIAETGDSEAYYYMGLLQKDGVGTKQSFKKSKKSFKKAYDLGSEKAAYCLGYYHLKGFGDVPQDYKKAYNWFKKSEEPIAKHWMAKMEFLGLGRQANRKKALNILKANDLYNSKVLLTQYKKNNPPNIKLSSLANSNISNAPVGTIYELNGLTKAPTYDQLVGNWEGELVELDWAKEKTLRTLPMSLELEKTSGINQQLEAKIKITDSITAGEGNYTAGKLAFSRFNVPIAKQYTDYPNFTHLRTHISEIELREIPSENETMMIGKLTADYPVWQERANPTFLVLKKKLSISKEALESFEAQADDFIKLFPNPFVNQLLVNFELPKAAKISVKVSNYYNTAPYENMVFQGQKAKGNHTIEVANGPTKPGTYLITILFDGKKETKIIIKN